jgi:hypothetical protein
MSLPNAYVGATHTGYTLTWVTGDTGHPPYDLTDATLSCWIALKGSNSWRQSDGVLTKTQPYTAGKFSWAFSEADVATPGNYQVVFRATYGDTTYDQTDPREWKVLPGP